MKMSEFKEDIGRRDAVHTERVQLLMSPNLVTKIDQWRREQDGIPTRSQAIRSLIIQGLCGDAVKAQTEGGASA